MQYIQRELEQQVLRAAKAFPAVVLTGPRRAGKTCLLQHLFPAADYVLMEDPDKISRFRQDAQGFLDGLRPPVILDEIQNVPEVLAFVRARIDRQPGLHGQWFLTGSQEAPLMQGVSESMAGRAAILQLLPLSARESPQATVLHGGFPEVLAAPDTAGLWFASYVQTYLERDVRAVTQVRDLATFRRFLALLASRHGQVLNKTDLAAPLGISVPTITQWLNVLEITAQILVVPPFFENLGKRLTKSPKVYLADSGLACHLLGVESDGDLEKAPFFGALFEGFIAGEILKAQTAAGRRRELYYFRDQQGLEVDFLVPGRGGQVRLLEVKTTRTPAPEMAAPMQRLAQAFERSHPGRPPVERILVHRQPKTPHPTTALAPGVRALAWEDFVKQPLS